MNKRNIIPDSEIHPKKYTQKWTHTACLVCSSKQVGVPDGKCNLNRAFCFYLVK